jgi:hypothetical protein
MEPPVKTEAERLAELDEFEKTRSGRYCRYSIYAVQVIMSPLLFPFVVWYVYYYNEDVNDDDDSHSAGVNVSLAHLSFVRKTAEPEKPKSSFGSLNFMKSSKLGGLMGNMRLKNVTKSIMGKKKLDKAELSHASGIPTYSSDALRPDKPVNAPTAKLSFSSVAQGGMQAKAIIEEELSKDPKNTLNSLALMNLTGKGKSGSSLASLAAKSRAKEMEADMPEGSDESGSGSDSDSEKDEEVEAPVVERKSFMGSLKRIASDRFGSGKGGQTGQSNNGGSDKGKVAIGVDGPLNAHVPTAAAKYAVEPETKAAPVADTDTESPRQNKSPSTNTITNTSTGAGTGGRSPPNRRDSLEGSKSSAPSLAQQQQEDQRATTPTGFKHKTMPAGLKSPEGLRSFLSKNSIAGPSVSLIMSHKAATVAPIG